MRQKNSPTIICLHLDAAVTTRLIAPSMTGIALIEALVATTRFSPVLSSSLATSAREKFLHNASPIFGSYIKRIDQKAEWMKSYADDRLLVHLNMPGIHDSTTWNYTRAAQDSLHGVADLKVAAMSIQKYFPVKVARKGKINSQGFYTYTLGSCAAYF